MYHSLSQVHSSHFLLRIIADQFCLEIPSITQYNRHITLRNIPPGDPNTSRGRLNGKLVLSDMYRHSCTVQPYANNQTWMCIFPLGMFCIERCHEVSVGADIFQAGLTIAQWFEVGPSRRSHSPELRSVYVLSRRSVSYGIHLYWQTIFSRHLQYPWTPLRTVTSYYLQGIMHNRCLPLICKLISQALRVFQHRTFICLSRVPSWIVFFHLTYRARQNLVHDLTHLRGVYLVRRECRVSVFWDWCITRGEGSLYSAVPSYAAAVRPPT